MIDLLVQHHADVNARDRRGVTVLANVMASGAADLAERLRSLRANLTDRSVMEALAAGHDAVVQIPSCAYTSTGACVADNNGLPIQLALTPGEASNIVCRSKARRRSEQKPIIVQFHRASPSLASHCDEFDHSILRHPMPPDT
jgi:hypothetical protein